ncbi:MAG: 2-C-methyl-D-erythritol 2,4-cyclodiphosphate synthase [Rikenellaceae bacterium]|nr:2-C-methyl-D-erythritol 2,4-cyclodiphosphate synthase [Rikenellaceae bacterium]
MSYRIGNGYDVHALGEGLPLWLGGIKIEHNKGCIAHSDGDVVIHAVCDALLGAAAMRDIGYHFPDNSSEFKGIDSKILLRKAVDLLRKEKYMIVNVDAVICLQEPKIKKIIPDMIGVMAEVMDVDQSLVSVKATTTEKLGFVGREEGIAVYAVAMIKNVIDGQ